MHAGVRARAGITQLVPPTAGATKSDSQVARVRMPTVRLTKGGVGTFDNLTRATWEERFRGILY